METHEVREIVGRELKPLMARLGIDHWKVRVRYEHKKARDGTIRRGLCTRLVDYEDALITLNPPAFDDAAEVLRTLRHELLHIVLAPFDLYSTSVDLLDLADGPRALLDRTWDHAVEKAVIALERMYSGLTDQEEPIQCGRSRS